MQTGKNYADNSPTNSSLRVKSPQLEKYVDENEDNKPYEINLNDEFTDILYGGFYVVTKILNDLQNIKCIELTNNNTGDKYIIKYSTMLEKSGDRINRDDEDFQFLRTGHNGELNQKGIDNTAKERLKAAYQKDPEKAYHRTGSYYVPDMDENEDSDTEKPTTDFDKLNQDKKDTGEVLHGGIGDGKLPEDFDKEQVLLGMTVEMEHSDNPMIALEIVLDHLTEDPEYYTTSENPESSAQYNASMKAKSFGNDEDAELTNELLGYKPRNVGEEVSKTSQSIEENDVDEAYVITADMLNTEPFLSIKNELLQKYAQDNRFGEYYGKERLDRLIKSSASWIRGALKRINPKAIADVLFKHDMKNLTGMPEKPYSEQEKSNVSTTNPIYRPIIRLLKQRLESQGMSETDTDNTINSIFQKNGKQIATIIGQKTPVDVVNAIMSKHGNKP